MYLNGMGLRGIERVEHSSHHRDALDSLMLGMNSRMRPRRMKFQKLLTWMNCKTWAKAKKSGSDCRESLAFGHPGLGCGRPDAETFALVDCQCWQSFGMERDGYGLSSVH